jgi:hypothetical protein
MSKHRSSQSTKTLMCPSSAAETADSVIFGIVLGTPEAPHVLHLDQVKPIPAELLELDAPVKPAEIFRIAGTCSENDCQHYDGSKCRLVERIVDGLPIVTEQIPACAIRSTCRWWYQSGKEACLRCQQIVRDNCIVTTELYQATDPAIYEECKIGASSA